MKLTYIQQSGSPPVGDGGDQYTGLDRFGRVVDQPVDEGEQRGGFGAGAVWV